MPSAAEIEQWIREMVPSLNPTDPEASLEDIALSLLAIVYVLADEVNILRAEHGLPARTKAQAFSAIKGKRDNLLNE